MKKLFTLLVTALLTINALSQAPEKMSYQAVVRNASGVLVKSSPVGIKISILQNTSTGDVVYAETHSVSTNSDGLVTLEIGNGTILSGTFSTIIWSNGSYFFKTEIDPAGGTNYTISGVSQLLSVPYALYSKSAETASDAVKTTGDQSIAGIKTFTGTINVSNNVITNVATPTSNTDAANKAYVDALWDKVLQLQADAGAKDVDGNIYKAVKIGKQVWMAENLKTTKYRNGDAIPNVTDNAAWGGLTTGGYCWHFNDAATYKDTYGALYNFYTVADSRQLCPLGWHMSTDAEWKILEMYLGMTQDQADALGFRGTTEGGKMKETGTTHWNTPNTGATNESGFTGLPSGHRYVDGNFISLGVNGHFWMAEQYDAGSAWHRTLEYDKAQVYRQYSGSKTNGMSVRCVKD